MLGKAKGRARGTEITSRTSVSKNCSCMSEARASSPPCAWDVRKSTGTKKSTLRMPGMAHQTGDALPVGASESQKGCARGGSWSSAAHFITSRRAVVCCFWDAVAQKGAGDRAQTMREGHMPALLGGTTAVELRRCVAVVCGSMSSAAVVRVRTAGSWEVASKGRRGCEARASGGRVEQQVKMLFLAPGLANGVLQPRGSVGASAYTSSITSKCQRVVPTLPR